MEESSSFGFNSLIPQSYKSKAEAFAKCLQDKLMLLGGYNESGNDNVNKKRLNETELNGNKKPEETFPYDITKFSEDNIFVQHPESLIKRDIQTPENRNIEVPKPNGKLKYIKDRRGYSSDSEESDREDLYKKTDNVQDLQNVNPDDGEIHHNGSETSDLVLNSHKQSEILHKRVHELINGNNEKNKETNRKLVSFSSEETTDSWHSCDDRDAYDSDDNEEVDYFASQIKGSPKLRSTKLRNRKRGCRDDESWKKSSRGNYSPVITQDVFADFDSECFSPVEDPEESEQLLQEEAEPDQNLVLLDGMDMENYDVPYRILRESSSANNLEKHFSQNNLEIDPIIVGDSYLRKKELVSSPMNLKPPSPDGYSHLLTPPPSPEANRDEILSTGDYVMNMKNLEEINGDYEELKEEEEDAAIDVQEVTLDERWLTEIAEEEETSLEMKIENGVDERTAKVETQRADNQNAESSPGVAVCECAFGEDAIESSKTVVNGGVEAGELVDNQNAEESRSDVPACENVIVEDTRESSETDEPSKKAAVIEENKKPEESSLGVTIDERTSVEDTQESKKIELVNREIETDDSTSLEAAEECTEDEEAVAEIDANERLLTEITKEEEGVAETSPEVEVNTEICAESTESIETGINSLNINETAVKIEVDSEINFADVISEPSIDQTEQTQEIEIAPPSFCSTFTKKGGMILECPCDNLKLPTLELFTPEESQSTCSIEVQIDNGEESNKEPEFTAEPVEESSNSGNELTVPTNKSEDDDSEEMLNPRLKLRRCSSLKTWKTPPGTPGRKKIVRFADALGLDLADVRTFLDEIPKIPSSAYEDLHFDLNSDPFSSCHCPAPPLPTMPTLIPMFPQPGGQIDFLERVKTLNISLESAVLTDTTVLTISGIIRVRNLDYNKSVHVRYSLDNWVTISDLQATYVPNSCDGFSDKFSFVLYGHTLKIGQTMEFALRLECLGCQYWDSNSGKNYVFQCLPQSPSTAIYTPLSSSPADSWTSKFY